MKTLLLALPLLLAACAFSHPDRDKDNAPQLVSSNLQGAAILYDGTVGNLREADLIAKHACERYQRNAALVNDAPASMGGSLAYYFCQ